MNCPECEYLGYPCPRHPCDCADDVISPGCDEHRHLLDEQPPEPCDPNLPEGHPLCLAA